jgi:sugar/nucleoside kinase (ribokinase family)
MHDVYAYGVIAPSTLIELRDDVPPPGGYAEIGGVYPSIGGEAAAGAHVLARLGVATKLAGNRLGSDDVSARTLALLSSAGVDCSAVAIAGPTPSVTEYILAAGATRTVLGTYRQLLEDGAWAEPSAEDVRSSRIVCLDPFFPGASERVAAWCVEAAVPYVTVDTAPDSEITASAAVAVISEEHASRSLGTSDPREVVPAYTRRCRGLVVYTRGGDELVFARGDEAPRRFAPFRVEAVDTTGAGDSFRAGIIYGMLRGYPDDDLVRTASAVAALVCLGLPGVLHSPTEPELLGFLARRT